MNKRWRLTALAGLLVAGVMLVAALVASQNYVRKPANLSVVQAQPAQAGAGPIDGLYSGVVALEWTLGGVYSDPLPTPAPPTQQPELGAVDLAIQLSQIGNTVGGYVSLDKTLIFSVEHTVNGAPMGPAVNGTFDGVNFVLESERLSSVVAGRPIERQFRLTGATVAGDPARLSGQYRETLWGYTQEPVTLLGVFTLQRPVFGQNAPDTTNKAPDVVADSATTIQGTPVTIHVLTNDSDSNGDTLAITSVSKPQFGTATTNGQRVVYTPNASFTGVDSFSYFVSDGKGGEAAGAVTVTVTRPDGSINQQPVAADDIATTRQGVAVVIDVVINDTDPDGDDLSISIEAQPGNGTATVVDGKIVYAPNAGFAGVDSFRYIAADGQGGAATATVTVTVIASNTTNQPPVAANDTATTAQNTPVTIDVAANDTDPDGDVLTVTLATLPDHGTAIVVGGKIVYTPNPGFVGTDSLTYTVSDGKGGAATATVTINVSSTGQSGGHALYLPLVQR